MDSGGRTVEGMWIAETTWPQLTKPGSKPRSPPGWFVAKAARCRTPWGGMHYTRPPEHLWSYRSLCDNLARHVESTPRLPPS